jgi:hypothetical protein
VQTLAHFRDGVQMAALRLVAEAAMDERHLKRLKAAS